MKKWLAATVALLLPAGVAHAGLSQNAIDVAGAMPSPTAALPLSVPFVEEQGRPMSLGDATGGTPSLLIFADYTCRTLCGPMVALAVAGLRQTTLRPGQDFRLVVVGIDAKDGPAQAQAMKARYLSPATGLFADARFLSGTDAAIRTVTTAAGYRFVYDAEHDQFAHPAVAYVVDAKGKIVRVLSALGVTGSDLRLALVDAGRGRIGTFGDRVRLLCYGFDPARGVYTASVTRWLTYGCFATLALLLAGVGVLVRAQRSAQP